MVLPGAETASHAARLSLSRDSKSSGLGTIQEDGKRPRRTWRRFCCCINPYHARSLEGDRGNDHVLESSGPPSARGIGRDDEGSSSDSDFSLRWCTTQPEK